MSAPLSNLARHWMVQARLYREAAEHSDDWDARLILVTFAMAYETAAAQLYGVIVNDPAA